VYTYFKHIISLCNLGGIWLMQALYYHNAHIPLCRVSPCNVRDFTVDHNAANCHQWKNYHR